MAPQASLVTPTPIVQSSAPANAAPKPWVPIPVAFTIFLAVCIAYTLSYVLYRTVMSRRRESEDDIPDSPDRGVSQFMNGARLTLNFGHNHKSTPLTPDEPPQVPEEEKPLTDPPRPAQSETPMSSPADSSSTPFIVLMPSFTIHSNEELAEPQPQEQEQRSSEPGPPASTPTPTQQPFSQRIAAKVKILSKDRAEAIALDPKLAPVQGPLRPLSMVPSSSRKKRMTLMGLGLRHPRGHVGDPETISEAQ